MTYLQVHAQTLLTHRKTYRLARCLGGVGPDRFAVVGRLLALWSWSVENAPEGCLGQPEEIGELVADACGWAGEPEQLIGAFVESGFVDRDAETGLLWLHDWDEHMAPLIERRRANAERMRQARASARNAREPEPEPERDGGRGQQVTRRASATPAETRGQHVTGVPETGNAPLSLAADDAHGQHVAAAEETAVDARAQHVRNTFAARAALEKSREENTEERDPLRGHVAAAADADSGDAISAPASVAGGVGHGDGVGVGVGVGAAPGLGGAGQGREREGAGKRQAQPPAESSEELRLARLLRAGILCNKPDAKVPRETPTALSGWARELDLMMRVDKRAPPDIERVMAYALGSPFWRRVLFSARQLRDKFDTIDAQQREDERNGKGKLQGSGIGIGNGHGRGRSGLRSLALERGRGSPTGDRGSEGQSRPAVGTRAYYEAAARHAGADPGSAREAAS